MWAITILALLIAVMLEGAAVYALWNWILIGVIGASVPALGFGVCCVIGFLLSMIFN